jgi:N6-adenosine-specific RNA methylase IME4
VTRYRTIVADPPWVTSAGPKHFQARKPTQANASAHDPRYTANTRQLEYPQMSVEEIAFIPVSDWVERDAHLYIWTINAYLEQTYSIARSWGFKPSTLLTWCKEPRGIGLGGTYALSNEHVLFCRRGSLKASTRVDRNWWLWKRQARHSQKPDAFLDVVESVSPGPYLEMFARRNRLGWDTWGNESLKHVDLEEAA